MAITDLTVQTIDAARKFVAARPGSPMDQAHLFAEALIELSRPNKVDTKRVLENGDWLRVDGGIVCDACGFELYDHPTVPGFEWLRRRCNGKLVKL